MADKIVQLKDKNSNNLYPVSGSSLADSVSTGAIVDGAVTPDKAIFTKYPSGTTERVVGEWLDGSKIYRRTFTGTYSEAANTRLNINLMSASNVKAIINVGGFVAYNPPDSGTTINPQNIVPFSESANDWAHIYKQGQNGSIVLAIKHSAAKTDLPYEVYVDYTKISD